MITTFFIPVTTDLEFPETVLGLTPAVMPERVEGNIYDINIYTDH